MGAVKKHDIVLRQLGSGNTTATLNDPAALTKLEQAFEEFLKAAKAINVKTVATIGEVFSDYFARRPPFSEKKKTEFPDAVVIASLRAWCAEDPPCAMYRTRHEMLIGTHRLSLSALAICRQLTRG